MEHKTARRTCSLLACLAVGVAAFAQQGIATGRQQDTAREHARFPTTRYVPARSMLGREIVNDLGQRIGALRDVFLDLSAASAWYAELTVEGGPVRVVPLSRLDPGRDNTLRLAGDVRGAESASAGTTRAVVNDDQRLSTLLGRPVRERGGQPVGRVDDVVIDMRADRVAYLVVRFEPGILRGNELLAIDPARFRATADLHAPLILQLDQSDLRQRLGYSRAEWEGLHDPAQWLDNRQ